MSGKWYRVILLFSSEFFYPVILSDLIGIQVLTGGDKPHPYRRTSAQTVAAGFIPARIGFPYIEIAQIMLFCSGVLDFGFGNFE